MNYTPNYILGQWQKPTGNTFEQYNAITGELISLAGSEDLDYKAMYKYAREVGGPTLRKMTFPERGLMLKQLALYLHKIKDKYYPISYWTGATKTDSWIDIEGGIGNLFVYASLRKQFQDAPFYVEGDVVNLSKDGSFIGHHIMLPKHGVAVHINAFNFPIWGMLEKIAVNLLAGVPAIVKPSEVTSYLTQAMVKDIIDSGILPQGSLQLVAGKGIGILDPATSQDVITFTGSAATGRMLKRLKHISDNSIPFNMEADSLNAAILGKDVTVESPEFALFIKEIRKEMTVKAGQKCTAIRRIIVPEKMVEPVRDALAKALDKTTVGNPSTEGVRMGALASQKQLESVRHQVGILAEKNEIIYGSLDDVSVLGADARKGAFLSPILLYNKQPLRVKSTHNIEAFGPVSTIMPYKKLEDAIKIANLGKGSLVSTICTNDDTIATEYVMNAAAFHGRILILNRESGVMNTGHGSVMPLLSHGGPGRAGGGEELGGIRGVKHYLQRTAIQGTPTSLTQVTQIYQPGGAQKESIIHPFRKHFEELEIGETLTTAKHTVTITDIINFANVSGDHFYAHVDETSLEGTIFTGRVAHGYYLMSKAAGLFVEAKKGPVLLNYGIEEMRFTKPVYPGTTIGVRITVKEKIFQEKRSEDDVPKGIVKWYIEIYDDEGDTVGVGTILTMVRRKG